MSLVIRAEVAEYMVRHLLDAYPYEGCGFLAGEPGADEMIACLPTANAAKSAKVYTVNPMDHLRADRDAESQGLEIAAVFHSHTHTEAYPSPTDVAQASVPQWRYVIVSLAGESPVIRAFRLNEGKISEESVVIAE